MSSLKSHQLVKNSLWHIKFFLTEEVDIKTGISKNGAGQQTILYVEAIIVTLFFKLFFTVKLILT